MTTLRASEIRKLVDQHFSLQWCRENIVLPLGVEHNQATGSNKLTIAIGNFSYLGTIGDFIRKRINNAGLECQFIEKPPEEIQRLLDQASQQRIISGTDLEGFEFSDESILDALQGADEEGSNGEFQFDFDDSDEQIIEEQALDLAMEMMGTKIQQAAAKIMISACRTGVSDIHVEPRQDNYKVRVRRDGVMQNYVTCHVPPASNSPLAIRTWQKWILPNGVHPKMGRSFDALKGRSWNFAAQQHRVNTERKW